MLARTLTIAAFFALTSAAAILQPGETIYFSAPVSLSDQRIRLSLWSTQEAVLDMSCDLSPVRVETLWGDRTTAVDDVRIRTRLFSVHGLTDYLTADSLFISVTNLGPAAWTYEDQISMNFRNREGSSWGISLNAPQSDESTAPVPEPSSFGLIAAGAAAFVSRVHQQR